MQQDQLANQIGIYHTIFLVCLVLFLLFLLADILLFFRLNILGVIGFLTGKTEKKTVQQMMSGEYGNSAALAGKKRKTKKKKGRGNSGRLKKSRSIMTPSGQLIMPDGDTVMESTGSDITDVLGSSITGKNNMEQIPAKEAPGAAFQSAAVNEPASRERPAREKENGGRPARRFTIEKEIILLHTEERI